MFPVGQTEVKKLIILVPMAKLLGGLMRGGMKLMSLRIFPESKNNGRELMRP